MAFLPDGEHPVEERAPSSPLHPGASRGRRENLLGRSCGAAALHTLLPAQDGLGAGISRVQSRDPGRNGAEPIPLWSDLRPQRAADPRRLFLAGFVQPKAPAL